MINVKEHGVVGDGITDDTQAFNAVLAGAASHAVYVPAGTYLIDAETSVQVPSNTDLRLNPSAVLTAAPNAAENYAVVAVHNAENVSIVGGQVEGERYSHQGTTGQWGHGIHLSNAKGVYLEGIDARGCWGDGLYIGDESEHVHIVRCRADGNRRQGMSVASCDGLRVRDSAFCNSLGAEPNSGVDIEPFNGGTVKHVSFDGCQFNGNAKHGLILNGVDGTVEDIQISRCEMNDNVECGLAPTLATNLRLNEVAVKRNGVSGFRFLRTSDVRGSVLEAIESGKYGIRLLYNNIDVQLSDIMIAGSVFRALAIDGTESEPAARLRISGGLIYDNADRGVWVGDYTSDISLVGLKLSNNAHNDFTLDSGDLLAVQDCDVDGAFVVGEGVSNSVVTGCILRGTITNDSATTTFVFNADGE